VLTTFFVALIPMMLISIVASVPNWLLNNSQLEESIDLYMGVVQTIAYLILWEAITARYFLALPTALHESPRDREFPDICGRAVNRVRPVYGAVVIALVLLAATACGLSIGMHWLQEQADLWMTSMPQIEPNTVMNQALKIGLSLIDYAINVATTLASIFVTIKIWQAIQDEEIDA
jgi:hypothetical protein